MKIEIHGNAEDAPVYSVHRAKLLNDPIYFAEQMGYPLYPWQKDMLRLAMKPGRKRILLGHHADHIIIDDMVGDDMEAETSKKRVDAYVNLTKANTNLNEARKIADRARDAYESLKEVVLSDEEVRLRAIEDGINECKSRIAENALVFGNARVYDNAQVFGNALVCDNARVCGNALVSGDALVCDNARVFGKARVSGNAQVFGKARVYDNAQVFGKARVYDNAQVVG